VLAWRARRSAAAGAGVDLEFPAPVC